jgi:hypothetical protein
VRIDRRLVPLAALALLSFPFDGRAQDSIADFYKGRQIKISVGFSAGGSSSLYAQTLARHMGKYLPGNPSLVVQHMPGAGGLVAANYVYNNAPRDGSEFAITARTAALEPLLGNQNARFDALKFNWIGNANIENSVCVAWHTASVKTIDDVFAKELIVGGASSAAQEVMFPRALNKLVGTKFKIVTGYPGSTEILLAMERGEVQGFCGIGWTFIKLRKGEWLKEKKINMLFQMALKKHPPRDRRRSGHPRLRQDRRGPAGARASVRAPGHGPTVLCPARRSGRARPCAADGLRASAARSRVPGGGGEAGRRGAARDRRGHPQAAGTHLCRTEAGGRPRQGGSGVANDGARMSHRGPKELRLFTTNAHPCVDNFGSPD